jgi:hypothetical protein
MGKEEIWGCGNIWQVWDMGYCVRPCSYLPTVIWALTAQAYSYGVYRKYLRFSTWVFSWP